VEEAMGEERDCRQTKLSLLSKKRHLEQTSPQGQSATVGEEKRGGGLEERDKRNCVRLYKGSKEKTKEVPNVTARLERRQKRKREVTG